MARTIEEFGIDRLTVAERLELIGQIWDSIDEADDAPIPVWHVELLERRLAAAEADPSAGVPFEAAMARLKERSQGPDGARP